MKTVISTVLGFFILSGSFVVFADQNHKEVDSQKGAPVEPEPALEEVIVTGTRYPEQVWRVPANTTVISKDDIEKAGATDLPDLLKSEIGLVVRDWLGNSRNASVAMRGINIESAAMNIVFLVDGRRLDDVDMAGYDWTEIPLGRIERIEIVRGSGSVLYGDNAIGGVINVITREGKDDFGARATARYGSYQMHEEEASCSGSAGKFRYAFDGRDSYTEGYRTNGYMRYGSLGARMGYDLDAGSVEVSTGYKNDRYGQPGALLESDLISGEYSRRDVEVDANTDNSIPYAETETYYFKLTPTFYVGDMVTVTADLIKEHKEPKSTNYWAVTWPTSKAINNTVDNEKDKLGILPQVLIESALGGLAENKLTFGYDNYVYELTTHSNNWIYGTGVLDAWYYQDIERDQYAYYVQDALTLFDILVLKGGYRYEKSDFISNFDDNDSPARTTRHAFDEEAAEIGISYLFGEGSNVYYNYNKGFRFPKSDEFMSLTTGVVNEELLPQKSEHHQIGINYQLNQRLKLGCCLFRLDTTDEIYYDNTVYQNLNYDGKIRRDGVETGLSLNALDWLTLKGTYTFTEAAFESGTYDGKNFPGVPEHSYALSSIVKIESFSFWASLHGAGTSYFVSDWDNSIQGEERRMAGYNVLDVKASYGHKSFQFFAGINNVLNEEYEEYAIEGINNDTWAYEPAYYPSPGRNFFAGLTYSY